MKIRTIEEIDKDLVQLSKRLKTVRKSSPALLPKLRNQIDVLLDERLAVMSV